MGEGEVGSEGTLRVRPRQLGLTTVWPVAIALKPEQTIFDRAGMYSDDIDSPD